MDGFTFYGEYYETIKKIKKASDRQTVLTAIVEYVFEDKEPQGLSEVAGIVFETFRKSLTKSKNNSGRGGRRTAKNKNRIETELKPIDDRIETELKPNCYQTEKRFEIGYAKETPLKEYPQKDKERTKEKENIYPQEREPQENHPPTAGACVREEEGEKMTCAEFLKKYPNVEVDTNIAAYGLDWSLLDERFQESKKYLQCNVHTLSWIKREYPTILKGKYKDKEERVQKDNGWAFFDKITEQLKAREAKGNDG